MLIDHLVTKWLETKRLKVQPERCVRTRNRFSSCHQCVEACPVSAISLTDGLRIQEDVCMDCMKCTHSCPSEVFYDEKYTEYFKEMPNRKVIAFSCEKDKSDRPYIKLGCLSQLDYALLIYAVTNSKRVSIQLNITKCMKCGKYDEGLQTYLEQTIGNLNSMLRDSVEIHYNNSSSTEMERNYTRRELITFFSKKMTRNVVSPLIPDEEEIKNLRVSLHQGTMRTMYYHLLATHQHIFNRKQMTQNLFTATLNFNSKNCDGCSVCARVCPTGALKFKEEEKAVSAMFNTKLCNGCRSCKDICKKNGIEVDDTLIELQTFLENQTWETVFTKELDYCK